MQKMIPASLMFVSLINDELDGQMNNRLNTKLEKFNKFLLRMMILHYIHSQKQGSWPTGFN